MTAWGLRTTGEEIVNATQPTGRFGRPEDVVGLTLFLGSSASAHVTGSHIIVDGGARYSRGIASTPKL
jgi:NAD(P)-dependent dehydrogenase (short-subunit alcohol dehydrogenase family)